ncbi:tetratricopeptide repeat protein [bacterium BMS3Bbin14]|nr:tetratricopeptide repeat protein [bacterium BMS3Bbin14]
MLNINLFQFDFGKINVSSFNVGSGYVGPASNRSFDNPGELQVPWHELQGKDLDPFALLSWHTRSSNFRGRDDEMIGLEQWALEERPISVKFISGEGGVGKSRLAAEFADHMEIRHDWSAGFVDLNKPQSFNLKRSGTLLIIDYPEEYQESVAEIFHDLARLDQTELKVCDPPIRLRVLFITRQHLKDWQKVITDAKANALVNITPVVLGGLSLEAAHELYNSALVKATEVMGEVVATLSEEMMAAWLEEAAENDQALFIVAAAIHNALYPQEETIKYSGRKVVRLLVEREDSRLRNISKEIGMADDNFCSILQAMANISDAIPIAAFHELLKDTGLQNGLPAKSTLAHCLRNTGLLTGGAVCAIKPDIIAAAFAVVVLTQAQELAPELVWQALSLDLAGGLNRLARLHHDAEIVLGMHEHTLGYWLARSVYSSPDRSALLAPILCRSHLPHALLPAAVAANETLLSKTDDKKELANICNNLGSCYSALGKRQEAFEASLRAVEICEQLAAADPGAFRPDLAGSLSNLGNRYSALGKRQEALEAALRAVEIYEQLAAADPGAFRPDLAVSLNNLGPFYSDLGKRQEALEAALRAVEIREQLAAADPGAFRPDLAMSLNNLGNRYSALGKRQEALEAALRAVEIREQLAAADPGAFRPDLAMSYGAIGNIYHADGQYEKAHDSFFRGIKLLAPIFMENRQGLQGLMNNLQADYLKMCRTLNKVPDRELQDLLEEEGTL